MRVAWFGSPSRGWLLLGLFVPAAIGCANPATSPSVLQGQITTLQSQQQTIANKNNELASRASTLDKDNQELETLLAQSKQQKQLADEQLVAIREQLAGVTQQLAQVKGDKALVEQKAEAIAATARKRVSASIANSSMRQSLPAANIPGVDSRVDGDVIRIELPADRIFQTGSAQLQSNSTLVLDAVAAEIQRSYPEQIIGVEGHTDGDLTVGGQPVNNHQVALARAAAVFDYLTLRSRLPTQQLFVVGHGGNHPVVSNATSAGKARNRRVELVIYPEKAGQ